MQGNQTKGLRRSGKRLLIAGVCAGAMLLSAPFALANLHGTFEGFPVVRVQVNGQTVQGDVPAVNLKGRTMIPLRLTSEALGATVSWDAATYTAHVSMPTSAPSSTMYDTLTIDGVQLQIKSIRKKPSDRPGTLSRFEVDVALKNYTDKKHKYSIRQTTLKTPHFEAPQVDAVASSLPFQTEIAPNATVSQTLVFYLTQSPDKDLEWLKLVMPSPNTTRNYELEIWNP